MNRGDLIASLQALNRKKIYGRHEWYDILRKFGILLVEHLPFVQSTVAGEPPSLVTLNLSLSPNMVSMVRMSKKLITIRLYGNQALIYGPQNRNLTDDSACDKAVTTPQELDDYLTEQCATESSPYYALLLELKGQYEAHK